MEIYILYAVISLGIVALIAHLIDRYGFIILFGIVIFGLLVIYAPPSKFNSFQNKQDKEQIKPAPFTSIPNPIRAILQSPSDGKKRVNVSPTREQGIHITINVNSDEKEKSIDATVGQEELILPLTEQLPSKYDTEKVNQKPSNEGFIILYNAYGLEGNADFSANDLKSKGFEGAYYFYFPDVTSEKKHRFGVSLCKPFASKEAALREKETYLAMAKEQGITIVGRIVKVKIDRK